MIKQQIKNPVEKPEGLADNVEHIAHDLHRLVASAETIIEDVRAAYKILVLPLLDWLESRPTKSRENAAEATE